MEEEEARIRKMMDDMDKATKNWEEVQELAVEKGYFHGMPVMLVDSDLDLCDRFGLKADYEKEQRARRKPAESGMEVRNAWYSIRGQHQVFICQDTKTKQIKKLLIPISAVKREMFLATSNAYAAWSVEAEETAVAKLKTLISSHQYSRYVLTGCLGERSRRTGLIYIFRKGRPTLAYREFNNGFRLLAALCMHPIGYYKRTWAGVMCPTDEVIAHLLMMRGDEYLFWKKSNQHPEHEPESGL